MGKVYSGSFWGDCVGRIEGANVYTGSFGGECIGRAEDVQIIGGAASLLLLM